MLTCLHVDGNMRNMKKAHKNNKTDSLSDCVQRAGRVSAERRRLAFALAEEVEAFLAKKTSPGELIKKLDDLSRAYEALVDSGWKPKTK